MLHRPLRGLLALTVLSSCLAGPSVLDAQGRDRLLEERTAVEQGLLPAVRFAGRPALAWSIEERMTRYKVPGLGIAVIRKGRIAWAAGYGVRRAGTTEAVSALTLFQAASISKPVAATAALRLVQEGRLHLDDDVNRSLGSWKVPRNPHATRVPVTLRALLSHTGGVTVPGFRGYARGEALPTLDQVLDGSPPANSPPVRVDQDPGTGYRYSGGGYQIVQRLIEDVTDAPFEEVVRDLVLLPFGMERSTFALSLPETLASDAAEGHRHDGVPVPGGGYRYPEQAAASLWSTPTDLARFSIGLMRAYRGDAGPVLDPRRAVEMLTKVAGNAGLGPGVHGRGAGLHFDHAGWTQGFRAYLVAYPETGDGVVVMANNDGAHELINEVVRSVARVYDWPDFKPRERGFTALDPSLLHSYAGEYVVAEHDLTLTVSGASDHLRISTPRGSFYTFYPTGAREFFALEDGSRLTITSVPGRPDELHIWGMVAPRRHAP